MRAVHKIFVVDESMLDVPEAAMVKEDSKTVETSSNDISRRTKLLKKPKKDCKPHNPDTAPQPTVKIKEEIPDAHPKMTDKRNLYGNVTFLSEDGKKFTRMTETHLRRQQISQLLEMEVPPWKIAEVRIQLL